MTCRLLAPEAIDPLIAAPSLVAEAPATDLPGAPLDASRLAEVLLGLRGAAGELRALSVDERIQGLARTAAVLRKACSGSAPPASINVAEDVIDRLSAATGYSGPVLRQGLADLWGAITVSELRRWFGRAGRQGDADLAVIIAAGNIPGIAVFPAVAGLLAGTPLLIKVSRAEPALAPLWHRTLALEAPPLARAVAVVLWDGGDREMEDLACAAADRVLVFGEDATVAALRARYGAHVIGFGTGLSLVVVAPGADLESAANGVARDLMIWDQQGCLSPRGVFVIGGARAAFELTTALREALTRLAPLLPPGAATPAEAALVRHFRADHEARGAAGEGNRFWRGAGPGGWTLALESSPGFRPGCLGRTLTVWPLEDPAELDALLAPWRRQLQGAALAVGAEHRADWVETLLRLGFSHVTEPGRLQAPPVDWRNRGRDLLAVMTEGEGPEVPA